mgnify:CR=1 FL=1
MTVRTTAARTLCSRPAKALFANRYDTRDDGQLALLALENEQEYAIIKHCFEELKAKLAEQAAEAAAQEGEPEA